MRNRRHNRPVNPLCPSYRSTGQAPHISPASETIAKLRHSGTSTSFRRKPESKGGPDGRLSRLAGETDGAYGMMVRSERGFFDSALS